MNRLPACPASQPTPPLASDIPTTHATFETGSKSAPRAAQATAVRLWAVAGRRLLRLLLASVAGTALVSSAIGLLAGSSLSRSLSVGFYLVGCGTLVLGFALAVRGPVRLGKGEQRGFRVVTRDERDDAIADSALLVALAIALLVLGVLADTRYPLL